MAVLVKIFAVALIMIFSILWGKFGNISLILGIGSLICFRAISSFYHIFESTGVETTLLTPLIKIIAIGYIAEFGANICTDAGASSIADKILFVAKIIILLTSLPIITTVVDMVVGLLWHCKNEHI